MQVVERSQLPPPLHVMRRPLLFKQPAHAMPLHLHSSTHLAQRNELSRLCVQRILQLLLVLVAGFELLLQQAKRTRVRVRVRVCACMCVSMSERVGGCARVCVSLYV